MGEKQPSEESEGQVFIFSYINFMVTVFKSLVCYTRVVYNTLISFSLAVVSLF